MTRLRLLALWLGLFPTLATAAEGTRPLAVLFLGDRGHHQPADRAAQLTPVLAGRGINVTYTEDLAVLTPETLDQYDALLVYANIDRIEPAQARALLDYVAAGGGFVPIHCASFCFRNDPGVVALIGAQFLKHGTGEFDTRVVDPDHPIMKGLEPFRTWDETYVHTLHNPKNRHVLQTRPEGDRGEPWTWVRTHGKGRVFYTAYGHDARTWGHPGFHDLIERGIRWAANKGEVFDSRPRVPAGLKPLTRVPAPSPIPHYVSGSKWGTQGEPISEMQLPVEPAESMKHLALPDGFEVKLFASEPEIGKPLTMAWDHRGRLWICESVDYPNNLQKAGQGHDRIKILEDTDGDGKADKFTVFAEGLSIPTSLTFSKGGVIVADAPDMLYLKDTDGDDKADERRVLFTGWGTRDTHAGPSNLRWGFDNWVWGMVGYSGFKGTVGGEDLDFKQGFYRFKPDGSKLEFLRSTNNNTWGLGLSEDGLVFGSTANGCPSVYMPVPNRYYESVRGWSPTVLRMISDSYRYFPITDKVRQVDWFGGFTAGAGHALYTARTYPEQYWNHTAFVAEPTGHLVATFTLHPKGADFESHNAWNLLASDDEWTAPTMAEVGPDGNVWVIDWYNYIVQHNPTPTGFKTGKGAAYETPLRDKTHGRIYRVVAKGGKPSPNPMLDPNDGPGLVRGLKSDNMLWRMHAQRLLVERGQTDVVPALVKLVEDRAVDAVGLNTPAIHALWAMHGLGVTDDPDRTGNRGAVLAEAALKHPSAGVRRAAVQVLPRNSFTLLVLNAEKGALTDPDPQVRLAAFLALSEIPPGDRAGQKIVKALVAGRADGDRWLADAATSAAAAHAPSFLKGLAAHRFEKPPGTTVTTIARRVAEHYARGGPADQVNALVVALAEADRGVVDAVVVGLAKGWPKGRPARLDPKAELALASLFEKLSPDVRGQYAALAGRWESIVLDRQAELFAVWYLATAKDESKSDAARATAARELIEFRTNDAGAVRELLALITPKTSPELATGLLDAVARSESPEVGKALAGSLGTLTPSARPAALRALLGRADWTPALIDAIEQGKVALAELSLDQKQMLAAHPNPAIASRARKFLEQGGGLPDPDRQKVIDALAPVVLRGGDAVKGKQVFKDQCSKCHMHNGEGNTIGPDLTGMAAHPRDELLVHVLDPSRSIEGNYTQYTVATDDGRILNGLLASETRTAIELVDTDAKRQVILRENIEELAASKKSLMPEGFEKQIPPESIADLLQFLTQRGKYLPLDLRKVANAVSTRGLLTITSKDDPAGRLAFDDWSPKTFEGVPFRLVDPKGDRVPNVVLLRGFRGPAPTTTATPRTVTLPCNAPAKAIHLLGAVSGGGYPGGREGAVSMIVRLHYADGATEDHPLRNGVELADFTRVVDVPGSKLAFKLRGGQQVRYVALHPKRPDETIAAIDLVKGPDGTAPVVVAVTVEGNE